MTASLTARDRVVLMALMAVNEEVTNPVLKERVGLTIEGKARLRLNESGLMTSTRVGRAYAHELTEDGWAWCWAEMAGPTPTGADSGTRSLYAVLAALRRYMEFAGLKPSDVFGLPAVPSDEPLEARIRSAYRELAPEPGDWVSLTDVRRLLGNVSRDDVDAVLLRLEREQDVHIAPQTDQRRLAPADRAAAVRIGGKNKHLLKVD